MSERSAASPQTRATCRVLLAVAAGAGALVLAQAAQAQSMSSTMSPYKYGYNGMGPGSFEQPINVQTRDANGNLVIVDGVTQVGSDQSVFARAQAGGAFDSFAGAGALGGSTAIGNNLSVVTEGNYNTVIVNANQTNNGNISATTVLNGKVNLDGGQ